ncbi:MAG: glycogen debranching protein GlgX [Alphaproteobacteria bacterium]
MPNPTTLPGRAAPLGATVTEGGTNFSVYSRDATGVELLLFDREDDLRPARSIALDPGPNLSYHYWHVHVPGVRAGQFYAWRMSGPAGPARGMRFDPSKVLLDPYGREVVVPDGWDRELAARPGVDDAAIAMKSVVVDPSDYDWEGDAPLQRSPARTIIYETHVRGFTRHPSSGVSAARRGTYAGLVDKIPHLQRIGVTAVELLPVFQFDATASPLGLVNYWGYQPVGFFAPHRAYSSESAPLGPTREFRDMVKALHRAGIEVILDVVFNHTAEGGDGGPWIGLRGIDNRVYYMLAPGGSGYADYSGCGNSLNANHPVVRRMILDSLRWWVTEMHVDGFRFDLASILSRDPKGAVLPSPPVLWDIESDPALAGTKLIAEAWDAAGLYQVGSFVGDAWREWNGHFRDDARDFFRGARGALGRFADRFVGSPAVYARERREVEQSVNFVTCHDGFTLNDLVTYDRKHNEANGEGGRDGSDDNRSWNCGVEGPTDDPAIEALRERQVKNFLVATLLSIGLPMICMGDEARRSQGGNNNAWCHDDETNWFDWSLVEKHAGLVRFVSMLAKRRLRREVEHDLRHLTLSEWIAQVAKAWHGVRLGEPDWGPDSHSIALSVELQESGALFHLVFNAWSEPLDFELPPTAGVPWRRWFDTSLASPEDVVEWDRAPAVEGGRYRVGPRSTVGLYLARS